MADMRGTYLDLIAVTGVMTAIYSFLLLLTWWHSEPANRKAQELNVWTLLPIMGLSQYFIAGYLFNMSQSPVRSILGMDAFIVAYLAMTAGPGIIAILLRLVKKKTPERVLKLKELQTYEQENKAEAIHRDLVRKISHIIQFAAIFAIDFIGFAVATAFYGVDINQTLFRLDFWGYGTVKYLTFPWSLAEWGNINARVSTARILLFDFFYCLFFVMLTSELCRHSATWQYPFDTAVHKSIRRDEGGRIASYVLFPAGYLFACMFLPYFAVIGILAGGCLGDLAASQVGMRWGRHCFPHQRKTWEGLVAGSVVTFLASFLFLGVIWAIVLVGCFIFVDFVTEKPIHMSDNLFFPLVGIIIFNLLTFLGIQIAPIIITMT
ncbi:MAG TPA: hypothetical protein VKK79_14985 [Candidatus Lokiarchaeia archaeon]|nr:hypothetical protein [Candidatus Lokiarchaeia archaeon]